MKHKIITTENYLLVVDDKYITDMPNNINVYSVRYNKPIRFAETENSYMKECFEIKSHLPLNNSPILEGVDLLPPLEDEVEQLAESMLPKKGTPHRQWVKMGIIAGYNKAKEKYKYTEEDVIRVVEKSRETGLTAEYLILSLQQPKMPVAFECEMVYRVKSGTIQEHKEGKAGYEYYEPQTTNNAQGLTQWVGEYIY